MHDDFAKDRVNQCKNHHYAQRNSLYKQLKVDFPTKQKIEIKARGLITSDLNGNKMFIVFQFESEDSLYPFDTIQVTSDIIDPHESPDEIGEGGKNPKVKPRPGRMMNNEPPSDNLVRQMIESSPSVENEHMKAIKETRTYNRKPPEGTTQRRYEKTDEESNLSSQPGSTKDSDTARADFREKEVKERKVSAATLDTFIELANSLKDYKFKVPINKAEISGQITDYDCTEVYVWKRENVKNLSKRESYDSSHSNRRKCAYVTFICQGKYVCLVEIDQAGLSENGLSTIVLVSSSKINVEVAEQVTEGYVRRYNLEDRAKAFESKNLNFLTKKHPSSSDESAQKSWRNKLIANILAVKC